MSADNFVRREQWKVISKLIKKRDGNKCQCCGSGNGHYEIVGKDISKTVTQVVHLNHNEHDNSEDNLLTMCQRCARKHEMGETPTRRLL